MAGGQIDVVSDFRYDAVNAQYNHDYKAWRKNTKSPCAYRYKGNEREKVYVSGKHAEHESVGKAERRALSLSAEIIGAALLVLLVCDLGGSSLLIWILRSCGVDIQLDFLTLSMRGNQWTVTAVRSLSELLKYGIPLCILIRFFRLPRRLIFPTGFGGLPEMAAAVGFGAICSAVYAVTANGGAVEMLQSIYIYKDPEAILTYAAFDVIVVSVISEVLLRGAILPVLRQFGDGYAVLMTALIAFLFPSGMAIRASRFLIGLAAGYVMVRSGSMRNCVILRVIFAALEYARVWVVYATNSMTLAEYVLLLFCGGAAAILVYAYARRGRLRFANRKTALPLRMKFATFVQTVTTLPWLAASALLALLQIFY